MRGVSLEHRIKESQKMGFRKAIVPANSGRIKTEQGFELVGVRTLVEALQAVGIGRYKKQR